MRISILTISDSASRGERQDLSGPALEARCKAFGWRVVSTQLASDDPVALSELMRTVAYSETADVLLTTGGTGLGPRDRTPEATLALSGRAIPGIGEEIRRKGAEITPTALLSRGVAIVCGKTIIVNLPGSPKGAVESLEAIAHLLPHAVEVIYGANHD
jgi:molybdopterin adenylyltransferase